MPLTWTERRAGLRAWLLTGAGPWITDGTHAGPSDIEAFGRHNVATARPRIRLLVVALLLLNAAAWATDDVLFAMIPGVQPALGDGRVRMTVFGLVFLAATWAPPLSRAAGAIALAWVGALGLCGGVAWTLGELGGPSTSWFHSTYIFLFVSLLAWASPLHRLALVGAMTAALLAAYFGPHPAYLADPFAGSALTHLLLVTLLVLVIGLRLDASRLRLFLFARDAGRESDRLGAQVTRQTARIQGLLDHVERAREDERRDIAAELHDEMGQVLTGMRLTLRVARTRAQAEHNPLSASLEQIGEMMQHLGWAVRNLLVRLRPRVLDDLGFVAAAEWLARRTDELPGLSCTFAAEPDLPELDADGATAAFRVLQESLTNAVRHAQPGRIDVRLGRAGSGVRVSVVDDGGGFDPGAVLGSGMGLMGMGERARARGGRLEIHSAPGQGTRVVLTLPARDSDDSSGGISDGISNGMVGRLDPSDEPHEA